MTQSIKHNRCWIGIGDAGINSLNDSYIGIRDKEGILHGLRVSAMDKLTESVPVDYGVEHFEEEDKIEESNEATVELGKQPGAYISFGLIDSTPPIIRNPKYPFPKGYVIGGTRTVGVGGDADTGQRIAEEDNKNIKKFLIKILAMESEGVRINCGLGSGTGGGATRAIISEIIATRKEIGKSVAYPIVHGIFPSYFERQTFYWKNIRDSFVNISSKTPVLLFDNDELALKHRAKEDRRFRSFLKKASLTRFELARKVTKVKENLTINKSTSAEEETINSEELDMTYKKSVLEYSNLDSKIVKDTDIRPEAAGYTTVNKELFFASQATTFFPFYISKPRRDEKDLMRVLRYGVSEGITYSTVAHWETKPLNSLEGIFEAAKSNPDLMLDLTKNALYLGQSMFSDFSSAKALFLLPYGPEKFNIDTGMEKVVEFIEKNMPDAVRHQGIITSDKIDRVGIFIVLSNPTIPKLEGVVNNII